MPKIQQVKKKKNQQKKILSLPVGSLYVRNCKEFSNVLILLLNENSYVKDNSDDTIWKIFSKEIPTGLAFNLENKDIWTPLFNPPTKDKK